MKHQRCYFIVEMKDVVKLRREIEENTSLEELNGKEIKCLFKRPGQMYVDSVGVTQPVPPTQAVLILNLPTGERGEVMQKKISNIIEMLKLKREQRAQAEKYSRL